MHDCVVAGAGIAGLSCAWELVRRGRRPLVLELGPRAGGVIRTETVNGFVLDAGPDALLVQKPAALDLCRELGLGDRLLPTLTPRTAFVVRRRRLVPLPEASFLGIPTRVGPFVTTRLFSWRGKVRMGCEILVPRRRDEADESIGAFIGRRFGQEAVAYLAEPLLAGIHAGDVHRLSMRALFPRLIEAERTHGSVLRALGSLWAPARPAAPATSRVEGAGTRTPADAGAFMSLPGGVQELVSALVDRLPAGTLRYGAGVASVSGSGPYRIALTSGAACDARAVVVATPAWAASAILAPIDAAIGQACGGIPYVSSAIVFLGFARHQVRHPLNGSGFVVPRAERRALMAGSWVSSKWPQRAPAGTVLLRGFLGGAGDPAVLGQNDQELTRSALDDFAALLGIIGEPLLSRVYRWPNASAQHEVGHLDRLRRIDERLTAHPGVYLTGSGFRGTGIPDCVADGRATGAKVDAFLAGR